MTETKQKKDMHLTDEGKKSILWDRVLDSLERVWCLRRPIQSEAQEASTSPFSFTFFRLRKETPMKTKILLSLVVGLATSLLITGCGGGGDSLATPAQVVTQTPKLALSITSATSNGEGSVSGTWTGNVTGVTGSATYACPSGSVAAAVSVTGSAFNATPTSELPASTTCIAAVTLTATGVAPATTEVTVATLAPWYKAVAIMPAGTKVFTQQVPVGCTNQSQACWRESLLSGLLKVSGPGQPLFGRPTYVIPLQNRNTSFGGTGLYQIVTVYADDFSPVDKGSLTGGSVGRFEWVIVTSAGTISYYPQVNGCSLWAYRADANGFTSLQSPCTP